MVGVTRDAAGSLAGGFLWWMLIGGSGDFWRMGFVVNDTWGGGGVNTGVVPMCWF